MKCDTFEKLYNRHLNAMPAEWMPKHLAEHAKSCPQCSETAEEYWLLHQKSLLLTQPEIPPELMKKLLAIPDLAAIPPAPIPWRDLGARVALPGAAGAAALLSATLLPPTEAVMVGLGVVAAGGFIYGYWLTKRSRLATKGK